MAKSHGSVRMGPISLFTLIITLCLAVMAVLAVTTAQASYSLTQRQAAAATEVYAVETAAQQFVGGLDAELTAARAANVPPAQAARNLADELPRLCDEAVAMSDLPVTADATMLADDKVAAQAGIVGVGRTGAGGTADSAPVEGATPLLDDEVGAVHASFITDGGRALDVVVGLRADGTYEILSWKATTLWNEEGAGETLWSGSPSLG
ncbi:MAG: hypothetical protein HFJ75_05415 [Eggerthellaceae bacterium]|nr:hypothetical protein [Eggerthellaceae bacterium]